MGKGFWIQVLSLCRAMASSNYSAIGPLHEFLPEGHVKDIVRELCSETRAAEDDVLTRRLSHNPTDWIISIHSTEHYICNACRALQIFFEAGMFHRVRKKSTLSNYNAESVNKRYICNACR